MNWEPKPGDKLWSSCAAEDVYEVLSSYQDENGAGVIDVRVLELNSIMHFDNDEQLSAGTFGTTPLTLAELPEGVHLILREMQWRVLDGSSELGMHIEVNAPVGGCSSCCYRLWVKP